MLGFVYFFLIVFCVVVYFVIGMGLFDVFNYVLIMIVIGGYLIYDLLFGYFDNLVLVWVVIVFMIIGVLLFVLII